MKVDRAWVELTSTCNNNCDWCYTRNKEKKAKHFNVFDLDKILSLLKAINCDKINFVGGEPTLHPELFDIISKCHYENFNTCIISNGRKFSDLDFTKTIAEFHDSVFVTFSIEGLPTIHNSITNTDCYSESFNGIQHCLNEGINVAINTTLCNKNIDCITSMYKRLISIGVNKFAMNFAVPPLNKIFKPRDYLRIQSVNKILQEVANLVEEDKINFIFTTPFPLCAFSNRTLGLIRSGVISVNTMCHIFNGAGITFDLHGNIVVCTHLSDIKVREFETIACIEDFESYWDITLEKTVRKKFRKYPSERCNSCSFNKFCTGGCPILWQFDFFYKELFNEY